MSEKDQQASRETAGAVPRSRVHIAEGQRGASPTQGGRPPTRPPAASPDGPAGTSTGGNKKK